MDRIRFDRLDALRGLAVVWMTLFHLGFDLAHFGWWRQDFYRDPLWTVQRTCIVALFLFCMGLSQAVAQSQGQTWARLGRRWVQVALCAGLVTLGSWWMFPRSFIYFGVLHAIAVMMVVARLSAGWGRGLWLAAALALVAKALTPWAHAQGLLPAWLDAPAWHWLGLVSQLPVTEDYVPLLPWLAAVWSGLACGQWVVRHRPGWLHGAAPAPLAWLGRWSLSWYLAHQPVMIGVLMALAWGSGGSIGR